MVNCTIKIIRSLIYRTISYHIQINVHLPKKAFHEICMFSSKMISSPNFLGLLLGFLLFVVVVFLHLTLMETIYHFFEGSKSVPLSFSIRKKAGT